VRVTRISGDEGGQIAAIRFKEVKRSELTAAFVLALLLPIAIFWFRGICWESLAFSIVGVAVGLAFLRAPFALWFATLAIVTAIGSLGLLGWSGVRFKTFDVFSSSYSRVTFCGRDFEPEGPPLSYIRTTGENATHVEGVTPSGSAIIGTGSCLSTLWVKSPGPKYQSFDLEGGP
jgi:hypothetical protein